jgi:hypothetical protein
MQERRASARNKVLLGGIAEINESHPTMECVVRNLSEDGACVELDSDAKLPNHVKLVIAQKGRSYLARLMWRQANRVGLAFMAMVTDAEMSDLDARLRRSEKKKKQLQRRINGLLGEG